MNSQAICDEVQDLMVKARHQVAERLHKLFQAPAVIVGVGEERAQRLASHTALGGATLLWVCAEMREAIVERRPEGRLPRKALWHIVDAIGHLSDCEPGRWRYFTDEKRRQSMRWATEELDQLEAAVEAASEVGEPIAA